MESNVRTLDRNLGFSFSALGSHFFHRGGEKKLPRAEKEKPRLGSLYAKTGFEEVFGSVFDVDSFSYKLGVKLVPSRMFQNRSTERVPIPE